MKSAFLATILKDIRSERPKITEKDKLRLLFVTKWFLDFFLSIRAKDKSDPASWNFGLIAEVTDRNWISWVLKRMREALDEKVRRHFLPVNDVTHFANSLSSGRSSKRVWSA